MFPGHLLHFLLRLHSPDSQCGHCLHHRWLAKTSLNTSNNCCVYKIICLAPTVAPVSIGLQQSQYSVLETEDYQFVCAEVQSGDVAGREIEINYIVEDSGMLYTNGLH